MQRFSEDVTISVMRGDAPSPAHPAAAEVTVSVCDFMYKAVTYTHSHFRST
jgi:hypothetical protein